ncbi:hypothetical protein [Marinisporobacter balticus]|uniref:Uncharacterized protein n=1 Tax=Marinisporobacter balticus TaxID=2018667 RepID=A0A4R2KWM1_9FIRM|nr:hypothetical protein [Marinisporobacter balticus]TCO74638.1 hypothetical protein EV214_112119 [Marinisporobacter balticus]
MEGKITLIGSFSTDWIRYSNYEYRESSMGEVYITPTEQTPFAEVGDIVINKYKNCVDLVKREDLPKFYGKRPVVLDLVF